LSGWALRMIGYTVVLFALVFWIGFSSPAKKCEHQCGSENSDTVLVVNYSEQEIKDSLFQVWVDSTHYRVMFKGWLDDRMKDKSLKKE